MNTNPNKNILICVSGLTPQIVTEAFYCLTVQRKISIDEIYILTTKRGRDVILGIDKNASTPKQAMKLELADLCKKYKLNLPQFENNSEHIIVAKEESVELADIRSDKHNKLFPNKVSEFIKKLTSHPENVLYCVISGGRKTMSVHLANALSLFGRESDKLLHVLTTEENEFKGFYPISKKEDKALELAEIPYIRLRSIISPSLNKKEFEKKSYTDFVEFAQKSLILISSQEKVLLNIITKEITYREKSIRLEPLLFTIFFKFVERKINKEKPFTQDELTSIDFGISVKKFLDEHIPTYHFMENMRDPWWKKGFGIESFRQKRSKINKKLKELFNDNNFFDDFKIASNKQYYTTTYQIKAGGNNFKIIYND